MFIDPVLWMVSVLCDSEVIAYLEYLHRCFVIVPIDKAANYFAFVCNTYYVSRMLGEVGLKYTTSSTCKCSKSRCD